MKARDAAFELSFKTFLTTGSPSIETPPAPTPNICVGTSSATTSDTPNNILKEESTAINNNKHEDTIVTIIKEEFVNLQSIFEDYSDVESTKNITTNNITTITEKNPILQI